MNLVDVKGMHFPRPIDYSPVMIAADPHTYHRPVTGTEAFPIDIEAVLVFREGSCKIRCAIFEFSEPLVRENMEDRLPAVYARGALDTCFLLDVCKIC